MNDCHNCKHRDAPFGGSPCRGCYNKIGFPSWEQRDLPAPVAVVTPATVAPAAALDVQVGGGHYKDMAIQPVEYIHRNGIGFIEGAVIKYISRWRSKNGVEDLKKAKHFIDLLIELEEKK